MRTIVSKTKYVATKLLDVIPAAIEIGVTAIDHKSGELSELIDRKCKELLGESKTGNHSPQKQQHLHVYREIAKQHDQKLEMIQSFEQRFDTKEQETIKKRFIQRMNELYHIRDMKKELEQER